MAISRISGNQIAQTTSAIITTLKFLNTNSVFKLPVGTTAQRPTGVDVGTLRFNSTDDSAEIYKADDGTGSAGWSPLAGGGPSLGADSVVRTNPNTISENLTIGPTAGSEFANGMSAGPVSVSSGVTLTISSGSVYTVV